MSNTEKKMAPLTRRTFIAGSAVTAAAAAGVALGGTTQARAQDKSTQDTAGYQAAPKDGQKCSGCTHFEAGKNSCKVVEGKISAEGWCKLFQAT